MYDGEVIRVRTTEGEIEASPITTGLHQEPALNPYLFTSVIDGLTRHIQKKIP